MTRQQLNRLGSVESLGNYFVIPNLVRVPHSLCCKLPCVIWFDNYYCLYPWRADASCEKCFGSRTTSESEQLDPGVRSSTVGNLSCTYTSQARSSAAPSFHQESCLSNLGNERPLGPLAVWISNVGKGPKGNWQLHKFATHGSWSVLHLFLNIRNRSRVLMLAAEREYKVFFSRRNWGPIDYIIFREVSIVGAGLATGNRLLHGQGAQNCTWLYPAISGTE